MPKDYIYINLPACQLLLRNLAFGNGETDTSYLWAWSFHKRRDLLLSRNGKGDIPPKHVLFSDASVISHQLISTKIINQIFF